MKLVSFSVTNYRSITTAHKINLNQYTVLIGKNNEGKSNISHALNLAMNILLAHSRKIVGRAGYLWERDFPMQIQNRKSGKQSRFRLEFLLNEMELEVFYNMIGSRLNGTIEIEIILSKESKMEITVPKKGKNASVLTRKSGLIAKFISERISVNYIPAVRTESFTLREIRKSISERLEILEENKEYTDAMKIINDLQQSILNEIAIEIRKPLQEFMPKIQEVSIQITEERRKDYFRSGIDVIVDDGNATNIEYKGDGVKSLAAIALLKENALKSITPIIIIEEPEVHLHPEAINQLNSIILGLSENNQVIVTTHNPLFVVRDNISSNIIVGNGIAKPAKNLKEIRDILGIKASDNLIDSKYVLVVEGEDDKEALKHILPLMSSKIEKAMKQNLFSIHEIGGAGNLSYKLSTLQNMIITYSVLLDDDSEGKVAYEKAERDNLITAKNVTFTTCIGMREAEFEDCLKYDAYVNKIKEDFNVDLLICPEFRKNDKWSNRIQCSFKSMGKPWSDTVEKKVKFLVVDEIKKKTDINDIFIPQKIAFIKGLILTIENMIKEF